MIHERTATPAVRRQRDGQVWLNSDLALAVGRHGRSSLGFLCQGARSCAPGVYCGMKLIPGLSAATNAASSFAVFSRSDSEMTSTGVCM